MYKLHLVKGPVDKRDHIIRAKNTVKAVKAATSVDLSEFCTGIKDQGDLGSCTAFASVGALEFLQKKYAKSSVNDIFSERFTYWTTRVDVLKWAPEDSGAYIRDAVKSLVKFGSCLEATCPYNGDFRTKPSDAAYTQGADYQALAYAKFEDGVSPKDRQTKITVLKSNLEAGLPIVAGFVCYSNIWSAVNGVIPAKNGQVIGGHAILLVGYNDTKRQFKFKNSWGSTWGDNGYGYLSYDYYINGDMFDLWTILRAENSNALPIGVEIVNPLVQQSEFKVSVSNLLKEIADNTDVALSTADTNAYFTALAIKYRSNAKLANLINVLRTTMRTMSV